ncbi:hypothetical protein F5888DRAFT_1613273 [Russula emetica]|nr:hypothetical protein F5888DRAFT_1613273 [Russula emetica]
MSHRKRKHRQRSFDTHSNQYDLQQASSSSSSTRPPDHSLFIVGHEADIIRGPQAARSADSLEVGINIDGQGGSRIGEGLIKWESKVGSSRDGRDAEGGGDMWVDRYDARLLLDALPPFFASIVDHTASNNDDALAPDSPGGWSDLPSDAEDTFFLTPEETADLHRTKRLRHLDALRTARLRALSPDADTTNADADTDTDPWGGSNEEPDEQQMELMRRTAAHTVRAANDAQLRARILAHHGADVRFAFLRGRWSHAWALAQAEANRAVLEEEREKAQSADALGGLTGYGSGSEEDDAEDDNVAAEDGQATQEAQSEEVALRVAQEARRAKAREWAEKRRAAKALVDGEKEDQ